MKRIILTMVAVMTLGVAANAMSYKSARDQAFFLTDKMAYELGLNDDQYNAVYEINLDYIMSVDVYDDLFGTFWERRDTELRYVLSPSQYEAYRILEYFYRPISWVNKRFVFTIYNHYPKNRFYRAAPPGYQVYKGSNRYFDHSAYHGRTYGTPAGKHQHNPGMSGGSHGTVKPGGSNSGGHKGGQMTKKEAVKAGKERMKSRRR